MAGIIRTILTNASSLSILFYILLNFACAGLELTYGITSNSLSLVSDSFHMLFDCAGLIMGLIAQAVIRGDDKKPNLVYTYGYGRADPVAGFASSCFLMFLLFMLCGEATQRMLLKTAPKVDGIAMQIACAGLAVNVLGILIILLRRRPKKIPQSATAVKKPVKQDPEYGIMLGMLLHVVADALGSVAVIGSSYLVEQTGTPWADPAASFVIALLLMLGIMPLLCDCKDILMQRAPRELDKSMKSMLDKLMTLANVKAVRDLHTWSLQKYDFVATVSLSIPDGRNRGEEERLIWGARSVFEENGIKNNTVQLEYGSLGDWVNEMVDGTRIKSEKGATVMERKLQRQERRALRANARDERKKKRKEDKARREAEENGIPYVPEKDGDENGTSASGTKLPRSKKLWARSKNLLKALKNKSKGKSKERGKASDGEGSDESPSADSKNA